jgi:PAS domain S-box-containing protein
MELQADEAFYKSLFENLIDGLAYCQMIYNPQAEPVDFLYLKVNKNFEDLTGLKNVVGKKVTELIPGIIDSNPELFQVYGQVALTGQSARFETYVKPLARWFDISVYSPKKEFFVAVFENITGRKQIEQNLENAKIAARNVLEDLSIEKLRAESVSAKDEAMLASIGEGLIITDEQGKIIQVNETFERLLGWTAQEVLGQKMLDVIKKVDEHGVLIPDKQRSLLRVLSGELAAGRVSTISHIHYYLCKDKSKLPIAGVVTPITLNNKIIGAVQVFRDASFEMNIDKAKTEFVSLASHQLRTPLSAINWYTEMLLTGDIGRLTQEQQEYVEVIYRSNHRMIELVNALLNVSRIESGTFIVEPQVIDAKKVMEQAIDEALPQFKNKNLVLVKAYDPDTPKLMADPKLLLVIFQNLISNAVKYTPSKGTVRIGLAVDRRQKALVITVADTGYGIPADQQDKIFTKLFRADNVRQKDTEGTGLGLYIVKSVVEHSGGTIRFESRENKGTTFYVNLPLAGMKKKAGTKGLE